MFSLESGLPLCVVKGGYDDKQVIFLDEGKRRLLKYKNVIEVDDGSFQQMPNVKTRCMYIFGASGSGKSTYAANLTRCFCNLYPGSTVLFFSKKNEDPAFRGIKITRIPVNDSYLENPMTIDSVKPNTLCIFDDCDAIENELVLKSLYNLQHQILELGRANNVKIIITSHQMTNKSKNHTKVVLTECQSFTFFPQSGITKGAKTLLKDYLECDLKTSRDIMKIDSRWITILTQYPQIVMSEHLLEFVSELGKD